jgi:guanylate kinase
LTAGAWLGHQRMADTDPSFPPPLDAASLGSDTLQRRGLMFILSSPSGAGKTTIARMLLDAEPNSACRCRRRPVDPPGEVDGRDYHFVPQTEFDRMVEDGEFYEWARVFGNSYGTPGADRAGSSRPRFPVRHRLARHAAVYQKAQADVVRVFILPPSLEELHRRLVGRGTDSAEVIAARMARAQAEISHWDGYDYVVINDDVETCFARCGRSFMQNACAARARPASSISSGS